MGYGRKDNNARTTADKVKTGITARDVLRFFLGKRDINTRSVKTQAATSTFRGRCFSIFFKSIPTTFAMLLLHGCSQQHKPVPLLRLERGFYKPVLPSCRHSELINGTFQCPELWRAASPEFSCRLMISHKMRSTKLLLPLAVQICRWRTTRERMGTCLLLLLS